MLRTVTEFPHHPEEIPIVCYFWARSVTLYQRGTLQIPLAHKANQPFRCGEGVSDTAETKTKIKLKSGNISHKSPAKWILNKSLKKKKSDERFAFKF